MPPSLPGLCVWNGGQPVRQAWDLTEAVPPPPNLVLNLVPGSPVVAGSSQEPHSPEWQRALRSQQWSWVASATSAKDSRHAAGPGAQTGELVLNLVFFGNDRLSSGYVRARTRGRRGLQGGGQAVCGNQQLQQEQHLFLVFSRVPNKL